MQGAKEPLHDVPHDLLHCSGCWDVWGVAIMWRPLSFKAQQMDNPGQKQHWILHHLSQKCPRSPIAFEDGDPFTLKKQDVTPAQCTCQTDTLWQCINTHSPVDKLYHLLVIILSVFWQENSRISQSLALFLWRHTVRDRDMQILRRKKVSKYWQHPHAEGAIKTKWRQGSILC